MADPGAPRRVLVLGGTQFIGRHIVEALLAAGHAVSILTRGRSPDPLPPQVERLHGDRDAGAAGLQALAGRRWHACIDVSGYTPRQVRASAEALHAHIERYAFVSAVMVYGDPHQRPVRESQPRVAPAAEDVTEVDGQTYGALKVACEDLLQALYGERCTVLRPQIVVGPHDPSGRYAHWVQRAAMSGGMGGAEGGAVASETGAEMMAPGDGSDHLQFIDVRDLARFVVTVIEHGLSGGFNLAGHRLTWAQFLDLLGARHLVWVPAPVLAAARLGFTELPLYRPEHGPRAGLMDVCNERARAAGLVLTPPQDTLHDVRRWLQGQAPVLMMTPAREATLIATAREAGLATAARQAGLATTAREATPTGPVHGSGV